MQRYLLSIFCAIMLLGLLYSCIDSYDARLQLSSNLLVVNGMITDQAGPQIITLSRAVSTADSSVNKPITKATVDVIVNGTVHIPLNETQAGTYQLPADFRGSVGNTYQLRFRTADGSSYESSVEIMAAVPPIKVAYNQLSPKLVAIGDTAIPASDVYIDYQDPVGQQNFYFWRWRLYEYQDICATCNQGRYVVLDIGPVGSGPINVLGCISDPTVRSYIYYDYVCRSQCWDIFYSTSVDVFSDIYTNGKTQFGHKVATIPAYQVRPALLLIEQLSLSANAYRYYKLFAEQVQNTGTLADSPPAPISGNIKNLDNLQENVVGYFSAASVSAYRHKITRHDLPFNKFIGLYRAQTNRHVNLETERNQGGIFGNKVPTAICIPSRTRTDVPPEGL